MSENDPSLRDIVIEIKNDVKWIKEDRVMTAAKVDALDNDVTSHKTIFKLVWGAIVVILGMLGVHISVGK